MVALNLANPHRYTIKRRVAGAQTTAASQDDQHSYDPERSARESHTRE